MIELKKGWICAFVTNDGQFHEAEYLGRMGSHYIFIWCTFSAVPKLPKRAFLIEEIVSAKPIMLITASSTNSDYGCALVAQLD